MIFLRERIQPDGEIELEPCSPCGQLIEILMWASAGMVVLTVPEKPVDQRVELIPGGEQIGTPAFVLEGVLRTPVDAFMHLTDCDFSNSEVYEYLDSLG